MGTEPSQLVTIILSGASQVRIMPCTAAQGAGGVFHTAFPCSSSLPPTQAASGGPGMSAYGRVVTDKEA